MATGEDHEHTQTDAGSAPLERRVRAIVEPLFLLHCGDVSDGERDDLEIEANSGRDVDELADQPPGETLHLYALTQKEVEAVNKLRSGCWASRPRQRKDKDMNLQPVIQWLENGCDVPDAIKELKIMQEMQGAVDAGDGVLMNEQAALLRECRAALDDLLQKKPIMAAMVCGSTTLGNLRAMMYEYRPQGVFGGTATPNV